MESRFPLPRLLPLALPDPASILPLAPLSSLLSLLMRRIASRHPTILRRLGAQANCRFLLDVIDTPLLVLMEPMLRRITVWHRERPPAYEAAIWGRLSGFLAMLHGGEDGDALFFSGELSICGDTSAVLALRNALDDAELDLTAEVVALGGAAGPLIGALAKLAERASGLSLHRSQPLEGFR